LWETCRTDNPDNQDICGPEPQYYELP
jgi:hypothetical protein